VPDAGAEPAAAAELGADEELGADAELGAAAPVPELEWQPVRTSPAAVATVSVPAMAEPEAKRDRGMLFPIGSSVPEPGLARATHVYSRTRGRRILETM
jgi:hypothetical protein